MKNLKKLTLLHSNDLHGDFAEESLDGKLIGGVSRLSGYVQKVRSEEENVIYAIAGDMFRGSLIDSEYKGISTIDMVNLIAPDVVTLGNHEVDYGLAHLLFIEKCAKFPIINANMYITMNHKRLFRSHLILNVGGMKIMFIGILTEDVLNATHQDSVIGSLVDVEAAAREVGKICNAYHTIDIDFTVLLTHIGIESDKELAASLNPEWGVDIIVGGHSHTLLDTPIIVNNIPIVQAASGTDQIGRFDIMIDTDNNCIDSYSWKLIPIDNEHCPRDFALEEVLKRYTMVTEKKFGQVMTRLSGTATHPDRWRETDLGRLMADAFRDILDVDIMMLGSGSIRRESIGPIVTHRDLREVMPFPDSVHMIVVTGKQFRHMVNFVLRPNGWGENEAYQYSRGVYIEYDRAENKLISLKFNGREVKDNDILHVGLQDFHFCNMKKFLDVTEDEIAKIKEPVILSTNCIDITEEYFCNKDRIKIPTDKRLVLLNND